jgi:hypothetical protein
MGMSEAEWHELEKLTEGSVYDKLLKKTEKVDEHPEGYNGPCLCHLCMSYGDAEWHNRR